MSEKSVIGLYNNIEHLQERLRVAESYQVQAALWAQTSDIEKQKCDAAQRQLAVAHTWRSELETHRSTVNRMNSVISTMQTHKNLVETLSQNVAGDRLKSEQLDLKIDRMRTDFQQLAICVQHLATNTLNKQEVAQQVSTMSTLTHRIEDMLHAQQNIQQQAILTNERVKVQEQLLMEERTVEEKSIF